MTALYLWDDATAGLFAPFALTRPVGELRAGAALIRERWESALGAAVRGFVGAPHLDDFDEPGAPPAVADVPAGSIVANSRFVPSLAAGAARAGAAPDDAVAWDGDGRVAAVRAPRDVTAAELRSLASIEELLPETTRGTSGVGVAGSWLEAPWELVGTLERQLAIDIEALGGTLDVARPEGATVLGDHPVLVERGAVVEPFVCLDATLGPILVRRGARVASFTRLVGPCYVGEHSTVLGGRVACASIGERCKVHGEVSHVVFLAFSNKAHDGFVGHSYMGRWVNLGAGTITSNLKNTYGTVSCWTPLGMRDTGQQFLGTLFGDHAKTGIGTRLSTGTVLGAGASIFGSAMPPRAVTPFSWGDGEPYDVYDSARFLAVAERVMARRGVALSERTRRQLQAAHRGRLDGSGE